MVKKLTGKVIAALLAVAMCFSFAGFAGIKEVHAATNKVINENTGVSYNTFSAAIAALGTGSPGESVTLTVDGTVSESVVTITVAYEGELSIVGGPEGGCIVHNDYAGYQGASVTFTENTHVVLIKDIQFKEGSYETSNARGWCQAHYLKFYGEVGTIDNLTIIDPNGPLYNDSNGVQYTSNGYIEKLRFFNGSSAERIINCHDVDTPLGYAQTVTVDEGATIGEIKGCDIQLLSVKGIVENVENICMPFDESMITGGFVNYYARCICPALMVHETGNVGTIKNSKIVGVEINGMVDTVDGVYSIVTYMGDDIVGGFVIGDTGRVNKIIGGSIFEVDRVEGTIGYAIENNSPYPVYLEPDLNGLDLAEGYGAYMSSYDSPIYDKNGTIVYPVSASGYLYEMSSQPDSYGYHHLVVGTTPGPVDPVTPTLYKRLLQNNSTLTPDMTFSFSFEQQSQWEGVQYVSTATPIGDKSVTITQNSERLTQDEYVGNLTGKKLYQEKVDNVLSDFTPTVAGTYCYLVKENVPTPGLSDVTYTGSQFIMLVEVDSNLDVTNVTNILYKDSSGKTKDQYSTPPEIFSRKNELIFYNTYGTTGGTTPTGIITNIAPFIIIGGAGITGLVLYVVINARRKAKLDAG